MINDLRSELSGKLRDVIVALMTPNDEFLAKEIRDAIGTVRVNINTLVEILMPATNAEIKSIKSAYKRCNNFKFRGEDQYEFGVIRRPHLTRRFSVS